MRNIDAKGHVTGQSLYVDDLPTWEGTLYGVVFYATVAHATLQQLDTSRARALPGVIDILTAKDIPGENQIGGILPDEELFASNEVHFQGQPIGLIVATSEAIAKKARQLISVDYQEKEVITDPRDAQTKGRLIFPPRTFSMGNTKQAWAACAYTVQGRADVNGQEHLYIETQGAYAYPMENGHIKISSSTQGPTAVQRTTARVLGVPMHTIEVDVVRLGGGFGGKEDQATPWAVMAALAAQKWSAPVKLILHRMDDMRMTGKRHPYSADYKLGLSSDLKMIAYEVVFYQNAGAAADLSPAVMERTLFHATNAYYIPNVVATAYSCKTNLPPNTAFRGFGGPQGMFVIEAAIAHAAHTLQVPKEKIQEANLLVKGNSFPYGQKITDNGLKTAWQQMQEKFALEDVKKSIVAYNQTHSTTKKGYALMPICFGISFTKTPMNQARALVHIYSDGSVGISTGAVEMGQGVNTKMIQVAAHVFDLPAHYIKLETTNTTRVANTSPTAASATADLNGKALEKACKTLLTRLKTCAANHLQTQPQNISLKQGQVWIKDKATAMDWSQLIEHAFLDRICLTENGHYATPVIHYNKTQEKGHPFAYHVMGLALTEVTVDCLRGTYHFDAVKIVHDFGKSMNMHVDRGQIEGGLVQGMGWMTLEELRYDPEGKLLSNSLSTYKVPDVYSAPEHIYIMSLPTQSTEMALLKSKAVGEPPLMYGIGAYFAIEHAISAFNPSYVPIQNAPFTHEKVLLSLYETGV